MDDFLRGLKTDVQCFLCNERLIEPKTLHCFHTFCKICIRRHAELRGVCDQVNVFKCPKCSTETTLLKLESVEQLKSSLLHSRVIQVLELVEGEKAVCSVSESHSEAVWYCIDCLRLLCQECRTSHSLFTKDHTVIDTKDLTVEDLQVLLSREIRCKFHVDQEMTFFCQDCDSMICHKCFIAKHNGHVMLSVNNYATTKKAIFSSHVDLLRTFEQELDDRLHLQADVALETKIDCEKAKETMRNNTMKVVEALEENLSQFENIMNDTIEEAETKALKIQRSLDKTRAKMVYMNQLIQQGLPSEMLENQDICEQKINLPEVSETVLKADIKAHCDKVTKCSLVFKLKPKGIAISGNLRIKGVKIKEVTGIAVNKTNTRIALANFRFHCVVVFDVNGNLLTKYGSELHCPESLSFLNNDTDLVVADFGNNRICIVNTSKGILVNTFGKQGTNEGEFNNPYGVSVDDKDNIIVCDCGNCRVQVFTKEGLYKYQIRLPPGIPIFALSHCGLYYVTDHTNGVIQVSDEDGNARTTIGEGQLSRPFGLAIDNDHNLLVCDSGNNCIKKFTLDGSFISKVGSTTIPWLRYIGVLRDGRVMVASIPRNRIIFIM